jgi:hypothetical protein
MIQDQSTLNPTFLYSLALHFLVLNRNELHLDLLEILSSEVFK